MAIPSPRTRFSRRRSRQNTWSAGCSPTTADWRSDAIGSAPGIYSARFAGPNASDADNNCHLIEKLGDLPLERRAARYVCHVAVADPTGVVRAESHGNCRGRIRFEPAGMNGFGYDPYFEVVEYHRTFGELGPTVKRVLSHRSRALRAILPQLLVLQ